MLFNIELIVGLIALFWSFILTILFFRTSSHYNNLTKGVSNKSLRAVLEKIIKDDENILKEIDSLKNLYVKIEKDSLLHIQKIGLLRFNPFKDTGGDQSFIIALTDANDTGVVISGLYSRSGTRWYAKKVVQGKAIDHELSEEEKKAIKEAKTHHG